MSARLFILIEIFHELLVWRRRHAPVSPNLEAERANSTDHRHHSAEKEPNGHGHVFSRLAIFRAVTKGARARLLRDEQDRPAYPEGYGAASIRQDCQNFFHAMMRSRFIFR